MTTLTFQQKEIDRISGHITIRGKKYLRKEASYESQVINPVLRQAYYAALRLSGGGKVSSNLAEAHCFAPLIAYLEDRASTTIYFNEIPGDLGKRLTRVPEDKFAKNVIVVNSQLIDRLEAHRFPHFKVIKYLNELHAFEITEEFRNVPIENEVKNKTTSK